MHSDQPKVEEASFDNMERELQTPEKPKSKKKKVSFTVWLEQQTKKSAENIRQQDENEIGSITITPGNSAEGTGTEDLTEVSKKPSISGLQETTDMIDKSSKSEKLTTKPKHIKKKPLLWKSFPDPDSCIDLSFFADSDIDNGPLPEKLNPHSALSSSGKRRFWKVLPNSEPPIDVSFIVESLTEVPDHQTEENIQGECLSKNLNSPKSSENKISEPKCTCLEKFKETELEYIKVQKYLMRQLDDMFGINRQLSAKLRNQENTMRKGVHERNQRKNSMVSIQVQTDSPDHPQQKTVGYRSVSVQTEMDKEESSHRLKPDRRTISTQTDIDVLETLKPVSQTVSTQTEIDVLETSYILEPVLQTIDLQTIDKDEDSEPNDEKQKVSVPPEKVVVQTEIATEQQVSEEEAVSVNQPDGDQLEKKKPSRKAKWRIKRKAAIKAASELKNLNKDVSGKNCEEASASETAQDETVKNNIYMTQAMMSSPQKMSEEPVIPESQPNGDHELKKRSSKTNKNKNKRKAALKALSGWETAKNDVCAENMKEEVSIPETVNNQTSTIMTEICQNETITKPELATVHEIPETEQSEDHLDEEHTETSTPDSETKSEIEMVSEQIESKLCSDPEDVTVEVPAVTAEGESGLLEEHGTPPPQMKEDEIQPTSQESEPEAAKESAEQKDTSEQEESPRKRISLWRRIKKALTPTSRRQFKDRH